MAAAAAAAAAGCGGCGGGRRGGRNLRSHGQSCAPASNQVAAVLAVKRVARSAGRFRDPRLESVAQGAGRVRQKAQPGKLLREASRRGIGASEGGKDGPAL